jgi:hypothetical protein
MGHGPRTRAQADARWQQVRARRRARDLAALAHEVCLVCIPAPRGGVGAFLAHVSLFEHAQRVLEARDAGEAFRRDPDLHLNDSTAR